MNDDTATPARNLSTGHQKQGDARRPKDTLDSPNTAATRAGDFDPGEDAGNAEPGGNPANQGA
jgi:hypothetical protein